jgi:neutral ceramidase
MSTTIFRRIGLGLVIFLGLIIIFLSISLGPVDRTPAQEFESFYKRMQIIDSLRTNKIEKPGKGFFVGYAKVNITPDHKTATAGYGNRKGEMFTSVHDSIYVRTIVIDNGEKKVAIVTADLLIIPPLVTERLQKKLPPIGFSLDNTFVGATHSHNSVGNWAKGATQFLYGDYDDAIVELISNKIAESIVIALKGTLAAKLKTKFLSAPDEVNNRLVDGGPEDPTLRSLEFHRSDSSKLVLVSYTAHATCLYSKNLELSRDYPGALVDALESKGYQFAMFMAGAVGSHKCNAPKMGWDCVSLLGNNLAEKYVSATTSKAQQNDSSLAMMRVPLPLSDPQVKITPNIKVRSWLFRKAFGEFPVYLTALRVGDVVLLGTPCDFSGEFNPAIDSLAQTLKLKTFVTSFNGGYTGYLTPAKYYDVNHYETQLMNWYAPGTGEYVEHCLEQLLLAISK